LREIPDRYEVVKKLGAGLSGEVFSVRDRLRERTVALKLSHAAVDSVHHIEKEFFTLSQLNHPNIVRAIDFGRTANRAHFTMEYVSGTPFTEHRFNSKPLLYGTIAQILAALRYIHSRGLVHCDLKPGNVLFKRGGPRLLDFGLAAVGDESTGARGSLAYIAPELFRGAKPDPRADLYSLGVLLYQNITGRLAFEGDTVTELVQQHVRRSPRRIKKKGVDPAFVALVMKLLEVDPGHRYDSADSVLEDLGEFSPGALEKLQKSRGAYVFSSPFVDREKELGSVERALSECKKGRARVILVTGQEGSGKSRLAGELRARAQMSGFLVAAFEYLRSGKPSPSLVPYAGRPSLFIVEDIHLADNHEISEIVRSIRRAAENPFVFLVTGEPGRAIDHVWSLLTSAVSITRISLEPLGKAEAEEMVACILHEIADKRDVTEAVYGLAGGIPLLIEEATKSMVRSGVLERRRGKWRLHPAVLASIRPSRRSAWVMERQLDGTSEDERALLEVSSLAGTGIDVEAFREATGYPERSILRDLTTLVNRGLMVRGENGEFSPSNTHLASLVVGLVSDVRLKDLHLSLSRALLESHPVPATKHLLLGSEDSAALETGLKRARELAARGRTDDARLLYEIALKKSLAPNQRFAVLEELSRVYDRSSEYRPGLESVYEAINVGEEIGLDVGDLRIRAAAMHRKLGERAEAEGMLDGVLSGSPDSRTRCSALCDLAWIFMEKAQMEKALRTAKEGRDIAEATGDARCLARVYHTLGAILWSEGKVEPSEELLEKAVQLKIELGDHSSAADSLNNLGVICWSKGDMDGAESTYGKALKEFEKVKDQGGIAAVRTNLGLVAWTRGQWEKALSDYESAYAIQERIGDEEALARLDNIIGVAEEHLGNWSKALFHFRRHLRFNRSRKDKKGVAVSLNSIGELLFKLGALGRAANAFEKCLVLRRKSDDLEGEALCLLNLALVKSESGDLEAARSHIENSIKIFTREKIEKDVGTAYRIKAEILYKMNRVSAALRSSRKAMILSQKSEDRLELSQIYRTLGMLPGAPPDERDNYFLESARIATDLNARYELGKTLLCHGSYLLARDGGLAESVQKLSDATSIFRRLGAQRELRRAKEHCAVAVSRIADLRGFGMGMLQVSALNEIAGLIGSIVDIGGFYERVVETMVRLLGAERGLLLMFAEDGRKLEVAAQSSMDSATLEDATTLSKGVVKETRGKGVPVISDDAAHDPRFNRNRSVILNNIHSLLCVPLKIGNEIVGTLYVDSRLDRRLFSKDDIPFVSTLANLMSIAIQNARYHDEVRRENIHLQNEIRERYGLQSIIGRSPAMQQVFTSISRIADTDSTVLIRGETGTGKELVARAIHYSSKRSQKRLLTIDCGALPEGLLESELFGHKRGSFTGAVADKMGLFEVSDGGTVFLDEIGDAPMSVQSRLLRVLEQSEVRRIGEGHYRKVDVRIICATNKELEKEVQAGRFRKDLYFRLNVLGIRLPPLRERREDIPLLANYFVEQMGKELGKKVEGITPGAVRALMVYNWPGNVRELKNEMAKACTLLPESQVVQRCDLSEAVRGEMERDGEERPLKKITGGIERGMILESLRSNEWNRSKAARELGLSRQGLINKMRRYGISVEQSSQGA
jgi:Nif-specific regulatory protein